MNLWKSLKDIKIFESLNLFSKIWTQDGENEAEGSGIFIGIPLPKRPETPDDAVRKGSAVVKGQSRVRNWLRIAEDYDDSVVEVLGGFYRTLFYDQPVLEGFLNTAAEKSMERLFFRLFYSLL